MLTESRPWAVSAEEQGQAFSVDAIVLKARSGDGFSPLGMREYWLMAKPLEQIHKPPPGSRGFDGNLSWGRDLGKELFDLGGIVTQAVLGYLTLKHQDGHLSHLRDSLVKIDADRYHNLGLLPQGVLGGLSGNQPTLKLEGRPMLL